MLFLLGPLTAAGLPVPEGPAALDAGFARHPLLTMVHIVPGLLFVVTGSAAVRFHAARAPAPACIVAMVGWCWRRE